MLHFHLILNKTSYVLKSLKVVNHMDNSFCRNRQPAWNLYDHPVVWRMWSSANAITRYIQERMLKYLRTAQ